MENRLGRTILIAIIAVGIGVLIVSKQTKDPVLREIIALQNKALAAQTIMQNKIEEISAGSVSGVIKDDGKGDDSTLKLVLRKQEALESRIKILEGQLAELKKSGLRAPDAERQGPPPEDFSKVYDIPVGQSVVIGKKDAKVTVVEFMDIQCPFCARFHPSMVEAVKALPEKANYMIKHFPLSFHKNAKPAAKATMAAAEQGKFEEFLDVLLKNNKELNNLTDEMMEGFAKDAGLNVKKFMKDWKDKDAQWEEIIKADAELTQKSEVRGTPAFFINGKKARSRDAEGFKKEIEAAYEEAMKK